MIFAIDNNRQCDYLQSKNKNVATKKTISKINKQINFGNQKHTREKKENIAMAVCAGMAISPLLPIIDGDSFKDTYGNKNVAKYVTGLAAIGGICTGGLLLGKKYFGEENQSIFNTFLFAVLAPFLLLIDQWAEKDKKPIAKKWYFASVLLGGTIGYIMSKINRSKSL